MTLAAALIAAAGLLAFASRVNADPPFAEEAIAQTGSKLDFNVSPLTLPAVASDRAGTTARAFLNDSNASIHGIRLANYSNLQKSGVLVWVVEIDGLSQRAIGGGLNTPLEQRPVITRATVLVSAKDGHVEAMYTTVPPKP